MKVEKSITAIRQIITCDDCGQETTRLWVCTACKCDLCVGCSKLCTLDREPQSDYAPRVCRGCNAVADKYTQRVHDLSNEYERRIEEIEEAWKDECRTVRLSRAKVTTQTG